MQLLKVQLLRTLFKDWKADKRKILKTRILKTEQITNMASVPVWSFFFFFFYLIIIDSWTNRSGNCIRDFLSHFMLFCDICHQVVYALHSSGKQPQTRTAIMRHYSWTGSFSPLIESDAGMYIHLSDRSTVNVIPWTADQIYSFGAGYSSLQALDSQSILLLHTVALWCCQSYQVNSNLFPGVLHVFVCFLHCLGSKAHVFENLGVGVGILKSFPLELNGWQGSVDPIQLLFISLFPL